MRQVPPWMGWGQLQARIRVQESYEREHREDAVFLPIHDMTVVMFLYISIKKLSQMTPGSRWPTSILNYCSVKGGLELRSLWEIKPGGDI